VLIGLYLRALRGNFSVLQTWQLLTLAALSIPFALSNSLLLLRTHREESIDRINRMIRI
jgi:hypothetical protein